MQARIGKGCSFFVPALSIYQLQYRVTIEYLGQALLMHAILSAAGLEGVVAGGWWQLPHLEEASCPDIWRYSFCNISTRFLAQWEHMLEFTLDVSQLVNWSEQRWSLAFRTRHHITGNHANALLAVSMSCDITTIPCTIDYNFTFKASTVRCRLISNKLSRCTSVIIGIFYNDYAREIAGSDPFINLKTAFNFLESKRTCMRILQLDSKVEPHSTVLSQADRIRLPSLTLIAAKAWFIQILMIPHMMYLLSTIKYRGN